MNRRLRVSVILIITAAVLVECLAAMGDKEKKMKKKRKPKGDKPGGGGGGKEDRAIKQALRTLAKVSKPLRIPPGTPSNKKGNNDNKDSSYRFPVAVSLDFGLTSVSDVNVNAGYVDLEGTTTTIWQDPRLKFHLPQIGEHEHRTLHVDPTTIWTPDIDLYNPVYPGLQASGHPLAVVSPTGDVFLMTQVRLRAACDVIGQLSTSEVVNCTLKMGSWTHNGQELQLNMNRANPNKLHNFVLTGLWTVTSAAGWVGEEMYSCCPESYPYAVFSFLLQKRAVAADLPAADLPAADVGKEKGLSFSRFG